VVVAGYVELGDLPPEIHVNVVHLAFLASVLVVHARSSDDQEPGAEGADGVALTRVFHLVFALGVHAVDASVLSQFGATVESLVFVVLRLASSN